ncbi:SAM hydrolase/SAM-dependent halogenase family protein [Desulfoplanes sp.]
MRHLPPVFLLTDFGTRDPYAAQMKAVILSHAPGATIVDYSHHVRPFDILQAGFLLWSGYSYFPQGSVIVGVVDPGVGTDRRILLVEYAGRIVIAPDNGLTGLLLPDDGCGVRVLAVHVDQAVTSRTFHGRDVFAPLAARVICGEPLEVLGEEISPLSLVRATWADPDRQGNMIRTHVLHVDGFGNCLLGLGIDAWKSVLGKRRGMVVQPWGRDVMPVCAYGELEAGQIGILAGSQGVYELCLRGNNAALELGIKAGDRVDLMVVEKSPIP